ADRRRTGGAAAGTGLSWGRWAGCGILGGRRKAIDVTALERRSIGLAQHDRVSAEDNGQRVGNPPIRHTEVLADRARWMSVGIERIVNSLHLEAPRRMYSVFGRRYRDRVASAVSRGLATFAVRVD